MTKEPLTAEVEQLGRQVANTTGVSWGNLKAYGRALQRWTAAGFPVRSQEDVERIFAETCGRPCEHNHKGRCKLCGCAVSESRIALTNKIKMQTEHCPVWLWGQDYVTPPGEPRIMVAEHRPREGAKEMYLYQFTLMMVPKIDLDMTGEPIGERPEPRPLVTIAPTLRLAQDAAEEAMPGWEAMTQVGKMTVVDAVSKRVKLDQIEVSPFQRQSQRPSPGMVAFPPNAQEPVLLEVKP